MSLFFDIKRYAINDGPGIRITLFFKGCPLSCVWCHNPEGIHCGKEKMYMEKKCIGCSSCIEACTQNALTLTEHGIQTDSQKCILCGECVKACPAKAMEMSGEEYTTDYLMNEIEKQSVFFGDTGGVTFCGGEPLKHPQMLKELLLLCGQKGIHRAVDTTLFASPKLVKEIAQETDLFLIDLKQMNSALHKKYTGVPNEPILSNICMIAEMGCDFIVRIPLIDGVNADTDNITRSAQFLSSLPWKRKAVNLLPYHDIGKNKHLKLGTIYNPLNYQMQEPSQEKQEEIITIFKAYGIDATIGG